MREPAPPQLRRYVLEDGWEILAGTSAEDNDALTFRVAGANDWWFHVRGLPGSHVVLRGPEGEDPPRSLLETAAAVAAHFSRAAKAGVVGVSCTQVKHVSRAARRPKGTVTIRREHVLKVRPGLPPVDESPDG